MPLRVQIISSKKRTPQFPYMLEQLVLGHDDFVSNDHDKCFIVLCSSSVFLVEWILVTFYLQPS